MSTTHFQYGQFSDYPKLGGDPEPNLSRSNGYAEYLQRTPVNAALLVRLRVCNVVEILANDYASGDAIEGGIPPLKDPYPSDL